MLLFKNTVWTVLYTLKKKGRKSICSIFPSVEMGLKAQIHVFPCVLPLFAEAEVATLQLHHLQVILH